MLGSIQDSVSHGIAPVESFHCNFDIFRIQHLINQGAKPEKIVLGIPAYGRSWSIEEGGWRSMEPPVTAMGAAPAG